MKNSARNFVKIIKEICEEENIQIEPFSYDWIFKLSKDNVFRYILGYQFGLNVASVHSICCDKSAASELMCSFGIPNVEHFFFMSPFNQKYVSEHGNWKKLIDLLTKYGQIVCKPNDGTSGNRVYHVTNQFELENAVYKIFNGSRSMAVSPFYEIINEYRTIVLDGEIKLIYYKQRPYIIGDGFHTIKELILKKACENDSDEDINFPNCDLSKVLCNGEYFYINWKHNLGQGAKAIILDDIIIMNKIASIVKMVVEKLNIRFGSIDIVDCNGELKVLEINSGVMMEHFSNQDANSYKIAKSIYRDAINKMFNNKEMI